MTAARVVEALYETEHPDAGVRSVSERVAVDQLALEGGEERLAHRVIETVPNRTHRRSDAGLAATPPELEAIAAVLNGRPRKTLGWKTPAEALNEHLLLATQGGVATTD